MSLQLPDSIVLACYYSNDDLFLYLVDLMPPLLLLIERVLHSYEIDIGSDSMAYGIACGPVTMTHCVILW